MNTLGKTKACAFAWHITLHGQFQPQSSIVLLVIGTSSFERLPWVCLPTRLYSLTYTICRNYKDEGEGSHLVMLIGVVFFLSFFLFPFLVFNIIFPQWSQNGCQMKPSIDQESAPMAINISWSSRRESHSFPQQKTVQESLDFASRLCHQWLNPWLWKPFPDTFTTAALNCVGLFLSVEKEVVEFCPDCFQDEIMK